MPVPLFRKPTQDGALSWDSWILALTSRIPLSEMQTPRLASVVSGICSPTTPSALLCLWGVTMLRQKKSLLSDIRVTASTRHTAPIQQASPLVTVMTATIADWLLRVISALSPTPFPTTLLLSTPRCSVVSPSRQMPLVLSIFSTMPVRMTNPASSLSARVLARISGAMTSYTMRCSTVCWGLGVSWWSLPVIWEQSRVGSASLQDNSLKACLSSIAAR